MMEIVPKVVDGAVVCYLEQSCSSTASHCTECSELAASIHNWVVTSEVPYVVLDFQDKQGVCSSFLESMLQMRRRFHTPFLFAGVMEKNRWVFDAYDYCRQWPIFMSSEDAIRALRIRHPSLTEAPFRDSLFLGQSIYESQLHADYRV
ncbi:MAG: hypothetical protein AB8C84_00815 [Oligoflexales bacterium]